MTDEQEIQNLFNNWIKSTLEGNLELCRQCIADDAVFFVPGVGEMNKEDFAQAMAGGSPEDSPYDYDLDCKLHELQIFGEKAYLTIKSSLVSSPKKGGSSTRMAGYSLSILEKRDGHWLIIRDANTMTVVSE